MFYIKGRGIVDTFWLIGPKNGYISPVDQDLFGIREEDVSMVSQHQNSLYEHPNLAVKGNDGHLSVEKPLSNTINRKASTPAGQCPFSGVKMSM